MKKVKSTLQDLINEGYTPLQIAFELNILQEDVYECPECGANSNISDITPDYVDDYEKSLCRNCHTKWKSVNFTFGREVL